jgi:hypothetical protein
MFQDQRDDHRLLQGLEQTVQRFGWELLSFALIDNRL